MKILKSLLLLFFACNCSAQNCSVRLIKKFDVPNNGNAEIIQYIPSKNILTVINSKNHFLDFYKVNSITAGDIEPIANIKINSEPTSVAANDKLNFVIMSRLAEPNQNSEIIFADVNSFQTIRKISFGVQLDSVGISPDGKWLIAADEAEENSQTPGAIWAMDLTSLQSQPVRLSGLDELTGIDLKILEPEFIAFDPQNKFAVVSCQENDIIVIIDLRNSFPILTGIIKLTDGAQPDGVAVIRDADGRAIIAVAEEGEKELNGKRSGQCVSFYSVADDLKKAAMLSRVDVRKYLCPEKPEKRCDPEGIALAKIGDRLFAFVGVERLNKLLTLEITDPCNPVFVSAEDTGLRPEGVTAVEKDGKIYVMTADEGDRDIDGSISLFGISVD